MKYTKPALTVDRQVDQLIQRGMVFHDRERAEHYLRELNYYRLAGYWLRRESDHGSHTFAPGTCFNDVLADYMFDRELRLLVLDAVERLEVSIRTRWAHVLGINHGSHAHLDGTLFRERSQTWNHAAAVAHLINAVTQSREGFVRHYDHYDELLPPIWVCVEVMSLGQISRWFSNLRLTVDRNTIAQGYALDERLLASFLHHVTVLRNICAHHGRLWDRDLRFKAQLPRKHPVALVASLDHRDGGSVYNSLSMLGWLLGRISPGQTWVARVAGLVSAHPPAASILGFPADFSERPIWQHTSIDAGPGDNDSNDAAGTTNTPSA